MEQTIELPAFRRSAELAPNTIDPETRSVEVIWSTGARVRRAALFGEPHDEDPQLAIQRADALADQRMRRLRPIEFPLSRYRDVVERMAVGSSSGTTRRGPYEPSV